MQSKEAKKSREKIQNESVFNHQVFIKNHMLKGWKYSSVVEHMLGVLKAWVQSPASKK